MHYFWLQTILVLWGYVKYYQQISGTINWPELKGMYDLINKVFDAAGVVIPFRQQGALQPRHTHPLDVMRTTHLKGKKNI